MSGEFRERPGRNASTDPAPAGMPRLFAPELREGSELGPYVIQRALGNGGAGLVYAAHDRVLDRQVAIKVLRPEVAAFPGMLSRFRLEVEAVEKIQHPNIVAIYDSQEIDGQPYYAMEFLEGCDLQELLHKQGRLSPDVALHLLEPVCNAVQAAHEASIVHRDIKAKNVFIAESHGERVVKLLDFGIAKAIGRDALGPGLTEPGTRLGTAQNMAPEQVRGEAVDARTDVYALGIVLFQVLTGQLPFQSSDSREVAVMQLQSPVPRPSALAPLAPDMDAVILRALEKRPERRFQSVAELLSAFRRAVTQAADVPADVRSHAIGVYFEIMHGDEEIDDEMFEDISIVLEIVEQELSNAGFLIPVRSSISLLGIRLLPDQGAAAYERDEAASLVSEIQAQIEGRAGPHPAIRVQVSLSVGDVLCRPAEQVQEVVGGPLLKVRSWPKETRLLDPSA